MYKKISFMVGLILILNLTACAKTSKISQISIPDGAEIRDSVGPYAKNALGYDIAGDLNAICSEQTNMIVAVGWKLTEEDDSREWISKKFTDDKSTLALMCLPKNTGGLLGSTLDGEVEVHITLMEETL